MSLLRFRLASPQEYPEIEELIITSFEPITWYKKVEREFGEMNGYGWRKRWHKRLAKIFATQIILAGEYGGRIVAASTGTADPETGLGFIELIGVDPAFQGRGFGRAMLRGMLDHLRGLGMEHAQLECLADNEKGNALYAAEGWRLVAGANYWFTKL